MQGQSGEFSKAVNYPIFHVSCTKCRAFATVPLHVRPRRTTCRFSASITAPSGLLQTASKTRVIKADNSLNSQICSTRDDRQKKTPEWSIITMWIAMGVSDRQDGAEAI